MRMNLYSPIVNSSLSFRYVSRTSLLSNNRNFLKLLIKIKRIIFLIVLFDQKITLLSGNLHLSSKNFINLYMSVLFFHFLRAAVLIDNLGLHSVYFSMYVWNIKCTCQTLFVPVNRYSKMFDLWSTNISRFLVFHNFHANYLWLFSVGPNELISIQSPVSFMEF